MEWFLRLDTTVQVAIIGLCSAVLAAIINGIFSIVRKKKNNNSKKTDIAITTINQSSSGKHNTFIGIQNNKKERERNEQ